MNLKKPLFFILFSLILLVPAFPAFAQVGYDTDSLANTLRVQTGGTGTFAWVVQNLSSDTLDVSVTVSGDGAQYVTLDNPNPAIPPNGSVSVILTVAAPTESGTFDATIIAKPANPESQAAGVFHEFSIISSSSQQNEGLDDAPQSETAPSNEDAPQSETAPSNEDAPQSETAPSNEDAPQSETAPSNEDAPQSETTPSHEGRASIPEKSSGPSHEGRASIPEKSSGPSHEGRASIPEKSSGPSHEGRASIPEKAAAPADGTSDGSSSGRSGGGGGGGGGGSGRIGVGPSSSSDAVYLKEVSWDCKAGLISVIAGPAVDSLHVSVRTSLAGVVQGTLSEDATVPGFKKFTAPMLADEDYIGIKVMSLSGRDSAILTESISVDSCTGSNQYSVPKDDDDDDAPKPDDGAAASVTPKDAIPVPKKEQPSSGVLEKPLGIAPFVDDTVDPQSYVDRYNSEPEYRKWFHENYPQYDTIYQAVGLPEPSVGAPTPDMECGMGYELVDGACREAVSETAPADDGSGMDDDDGGGGCLIATAAFGTELAPQVQSLRETRDGTLMQTSSGQSFMGAFNAVYYSFSPQIADMQRQNPAFNDAVRLAITPMLYTLPVMDAAHDEASAVSLGLAVISLNALMYAGLPAVGMLFLARAAGGRRRSSGGGDGGGLDRAQSS